eukprot:179506_1
MAAIQPSLLDPDKFGLLIQCRQKMDELNTVQLHDYAQRILALLSSTQLKKLFFVGCNAIKKHIEYHQLLEMKSSINQIIEEINKEKRLKNQQQTQDIHKSPIAIIPKAASLTQYIPSDIISNHICHFLKMSSITKLAQCDRQLAIICHTPTSICNLMHRHDPYRYNRREFAANGIIDGHYYNMDQWNPSTMHRFKNIEKLSISLPFFGHHASEFAILFNNIKHLSLIDTQDCDTSYPFNNIEVLSLLSSICFVSIYKLPDLLHIVKRRTTTQFAKLNAISFIDTRICVDNLNDWVDFTADHALFNEYENIVNFILPSQPNNLEILRFENSLFEGIDEDVYDEILNLDRIKLSLSNLKGFVYSEPVNVDDATNSNMLFDLSTTILNNVSSFKMLESIHFHSLDDMQLLTSFLNEGNTNALCQISELCISVPIRKPSIILSCLRTFLPRLQKLCVVIYLPESDSPDNISILGETISTILRMQTKLKVFQMVAIMDEEECSTDLTDDTFCAKRIVILTGLLKSLIQSLNVLKRCCVVASRSLVFRLHIKSCHNNRQPQCLGTLGHKSKSDDGAFVNTIQDMILNYLMTYPLGKIQIKSSWNVFLYCGYGHSLDLLKESDIRGLSRLVNKIDIKKGGNTEKDKKRHLYYETDFKQYAISASNKDANDKNIDYNCNTQWKVDCRYCCNTSWV